MIKTLYLVPICIKVTSSKWFGNYPTHKQQIVQINGVQGRKIKIICGGPQGSVLDPLFYILYMNMDGKIVTYEYDTVYFLQIICDFLYNNKQ